MMATSKAPYAQHGRRSRSVEDLRLNFFLAHLSAEIVDVWVGAWNGQDAADALREEVPGLVTWRDASDASRLYAWHPKQKIEHAPPGLSHVTVRLDENPALFQRMLNDAVEARFGELGFTKRRGGYVNFDGKMLLGGIEALTVLNAEPIGLFAKIVVDVFFTRDAASDLQFGLTVDVRYTTQMEISAAEWIAAGLHDDLHGLYVVLLPSAPEAENHPELVNRLLGRVTEIHQDRAVLDDYLTLDWATVPLKSVAPEPKRVNLERYLEARYEDAYRRSKMEIERRISGLIQARRKFELIEAAIERLLPRPENGGSQHLQLVPGLTAGLQPWARAGDHRFPCRMLQRPQFSFDGAGNKLSARIDKGLIDYGPYDSEQTSRDPVHVLVVAPSDLRGEVERVLPKVKRGLRTNAGVFRGLDIMYRPTKFEFRIEWATVSDSKPMVGYAQAIRQAFRNGTPDLVLVVIKEAYRRLPSSENPYFQTKGLTLTLDQVPTQAIRIETLRATDHQLQYKLNNICLACYAKLGRTSHVLRLPESIEPCTELVFGVGRSVTRRDRLGEATETIGFATVFRANGEYLYHDATPYCAGADYPRALERTIARAIRNVADFEQLAAGSKMRLIFHIHRQTGRRDIQPILNAIRKIPEYQIDFGLLHVNDNHNFRLFDPSNKSPVVRQRERPEAAFVPKRGRCVTLGPRERLITFVGPEQYRNRGCPTPIKLTLDKASTFRNLAYLSEQVFSLSFMSARGMSPGVKPVTLIYAEELARITGHLRNVQQWTVELIQDRLARKLWFI